MISFISYIPVIFVFVFGFLISKFIRPLGELNLAERIAVWFGLGLLMAALNSLLLGLAKLLFMLLPISCIEIVALFVLLLIKERVKIQPKKFFHLREFFHSSATFVLVVLLALGFFLVSTRSVDFIRTPDDYKNVYWAKMLMTNKIVSPGGLGINGSDYSSEIWPWVQKYAYGLSLVYFFQVGDYSLLTGQVLSALFYSMLILAAFLLGSLRSKKTGLLAAILIAFNPMIFIFSDHIMTDIPVAAVATLSLYFFIKSYELENINRKFLLIALLLASIAVFTKPTALFLYPFLSVYALKGQTSKIKKMELLGRLLPIFIFISSFATDACRIFFSGIPSGSWRNFVDPLKIFTWSSNDWMTYLFSSPLGAYGTFIFPYLYTYAVALLALMGCLYILAKERRKLNLLFFATLVLILWIFTTSPGLEGFVRHIFIIFPIIMYFAAIGLQSRRYSLMVIPFFLVLILIPEQGYVPYVQNSILPESFRSIMKLTGVAVVVLLILSDLFLKRRTERILLGFLSHTKKYEFSINVRDMLVVATLLLTVSASIFSGFFYLHNAPLEVNENITIESVGIKQAVTWVDSNIPQNSRIATNNFYQFPFYLSYMSSKKYSLIYIPGTYNSSKDDAYNAFLSLTSNGEIDYLIIFTVLGYMHWYPYLGDYLNNPPPRMHEINRTSTFVVYKTWSVIGEIGWQSNFSQGWTYGWSEDPRAAYQMASYGFETSGGILHVFGLSESGDKTPWAHWVVMGTSPLSIDMAKYPYLIADCRNENNNSEIQVGVVTNGEAFYPIDTTSSGNLFIVVDLRKYGPSGNATEIFIRARTFGENMTLNLYFDHISFVSAVE